eukprot:TRINITY_DN1881_c0_g1_i2.p2 TRINITY_DN1881_c0_g1~~TRINITY_DN1881_c0_g1_i2.p2  ORF type:complete len:107 (+),score=16.24 TRINITY_DN1881_c0_g1_i2:683-1003(+)
MVVSACTNLFTTLPLKNKGAKNRYRLMMVKSLQIPASLTADPFGSYPLTINEVNPAHEAVVLLDLFGELNADLGADFIFFTHLPAFARTLENGRGLKTSEKVNIFR